MKKNNFIPKIGNYKAIFKEGKKIVYPQIATLIHYIQNSVQRLESAGGGGFLLITNNFGGGYKIIFI